MESHSTARVRAARSSLIALAALLTDPACTSGPARVDGSLTPAHLRCEYFVDPLGIDVQSPRLSWELAPPASAGDLRGQRQTAYQLQAASSAALLEQGRPDLWDSARVESADTLQVAYAGEPLSAGQRVFWHVRVWDQDRRASEWSAAATWTMGLLSPGDWRASWIGAEAGREGAVRKGIGYHAKEARSLDETKWVQVDLGAQRPIDRLRLRAVQQHGGAAVFGFPVRFKIESSDDPEFRTARLLADQTAEDCVPPPGGALELEGDGAAARFVRVTATRLWPRSDGVGCFALSELEVESAGIQAALDAPVSALDSVEAWGWTAAALTDGAGNPSEFVTVLLRKDFSVHATVLRALAFVSGLGQYELSLNGAKVGDWWITPAWTQYQKTVVYDTYDVTALLQPGANALGLRLGNGMYHMEGDTRGAQQLRSLGRPKGIVQVRIDYVDGTSDTLASDGSWKVAPGPTTYSGVFGGEDYDARQEQPGWDAPGFDESRWQPALEVPAPSGKLAGLSKSAPPLVLSQTRTPVQVTRPRPGVQVLDLGQNAPYIPRIAVRGERGTTIRLWPAEILAADGTVDQTTMRPGKHVSYTCRGGDRETWWPRFWYVGSRYWQAEAFSPSGAPLPVEEVLEEFTGLLVHSSSTPVGSFECSDELFNRIRDLVVWAMRSNLASVVSDCPHREKSGWLEQIHLNCAGLAYSFDMAALFRKTVEDCADAQQADGMVPTMAPEYFIYDAGFRDSVEWGGAYVLVPRLMHQWYGDESLVGRHYAGMRRYLDYLGTRAQEHVLATGLGDWNGYGTDERTPVALTDTAYYYLLARTLCDFALALERPADSAQLGALAEEIRAAFNRAFLDPATGQYATGSQSCQATALDLGLVPQAQQVAAFERLLEDVRAQDYAVSCGEVGHPSLLRVLADGGRSDLVYRIHHQSERPGYGWQLARGATTLTEAWDASPISHNHFMLGHILEWFYADLAGLRPDPRTPGFQRFVVRPRPLEPITWARASYHSIRGPIAVAWRRSEGSFTLEVSVPPNTSAEIHVPAADAAAVSEGGRPAREAPGVEFLRAQGGAAVFAIGSGDYRFVAAP